MSLSTGPGADRASAAAEKTDWSVCLTRSYTFRPVDAIVVLVSRVDGGARWWVAPTYRPTGPFRCRLQMCQSCSIALESSADANSSTAPGAASRDRDTAISPLMMSAPTLD